jgi:hypothetical protein
MEAIHAARDVVTTGCAGERGVNAAALPDGVARAGALCAGAILVSNFIFVRVPALGRRLQLEW